MKSRTIVTLTLALALIIIVMVIAVLVTFSGSVQAQKIDTQRAFQTNFGNSQSMKIIDLNADGEDDLFVQNENSLAVFDQTGNPLFKFQYPAPLVTSMGDIDHDNNEEILAFYQEGGEAKVRLIQNGTESAVYTIPELGKPARVAMIHFPGGTQIILGDENGMLVGLQPNGAEVWRLKLSGFSEVRGLDDTLLNNVTHLSAANRDGVVNLIDEKGNSIWSFMITGGLRRLRAYDLNSDGNSELALGGENGSLILVNALEKKEIFRESLGQAITEIREAEVDGDPSSREIVAGGKEGGVWAYNLNGKRLWSGTVGDKVTEIAGVDVDEDGDFDIVIGDESGGLTLFIAPSGSRLPLKSHSTAINRLDSGKLGGERGLAIADTRNVEFITLAVSQLPGMNYSPIIVGLVISLIIALAAWFIATNPPKPAKRIAVEDLSSEGLLAQRRMLKESIADVERLRETGEMTAEAYLARLKHLRKQLAGNEAAMRKAGIPFTPETIQCPNCGGSIPLGSDRCEYCGQVVLT